MVNRFLMDMFAFCYSSPLHEVRESYKGVNNVMDTSDPSTRYSYSARTITDISLSSWQRNGDQSKAHIQEASKENIKILVSIDKSVVATLLKVCVLFRMAIRPYWRCNNQIRGILRQTATVAMKV